MATALLSLAGAGCNSSASYAAIFQEQMEAQKDLTGILGTVVDKESMSAARERLEKKSAAFEAIKKRAAALPPPSAEIRQRLQEQFGAQMQESLAALLAEVRRVKELPGGQEFLESFAAFTAAGRKKQP